MGPKVVPAPHQVCPTHPTSFSCTHSTSELTRWPISRSRDYVFALPPMKHGFGMPFRCRGDISPLNNWRSAIQISLYAHLCRRDEPGPCFDVEGIDSSMHRGKEGKRMREIESIYYICHYGFSPIFLVVTPHSHPSLPENERD